MTDNGREPDAIDSAIAAARSVVMRQIQVTISSTGRSAVLVVPTDASEAELVELAGWLLVNVIPAFRSERAGEAAGRIALPGGSLRLVPPA